MTHQRLKDFWINKINALMTANSVEPDILDAGADWAEKMNDMNKWSDIDNFGKNVCKDIYVKAGKTVPKSFIKGQNYGKVLDDTFTDYELQFIHLVNVCKVKIGVDPTDETLATNADGSNIIVDGRAIPKWENIIFKKIPGKWFKLTDIPDGKDVADLAYVNSIYEKITDDIDGLPDIMLRGMTEHYPHAFGFNWDYKVNDTALQEYKNSKPTITTAETHLGLNPGDLATITTNAAYNMNGKTLAQLLTPHTCPPCALTHCPPAHSDYNTIKGESAEYQRIHTKLSGKVSDSELDNLLNQTPNCSHTDYDTIKQERDDLKQQKENYSTEKQQAIQDKEKEIINKIITDLGLATEREREREH